MSNDARLSKADRDAYNEYYASKGLDNAVSAAGTIQDDILGMKRQKEEQRAKSQQRALDAYKAIKEARDREDARFYEEFGMTVDEAKHAFGLSKGELRDLKAKASSEKDNSAFIQTTTKKVTTRTDGELPETTVEEVNALGGDLPEDTQIVESESVPPEYAAGDEIQTPFKGLKGKAKITGYNLSIPTSHDPVWMVLDIDNQPYSFSGKTVSPALPEGVDVFDLIEDLKGNHIGWYNDLYNITDGKRKHTPFSANHLDNAAIDKLNTADNGDHYWDYMDGPDSIRSKLKAAYDDGLSYDDFDDDLWSNIPKSLQRKFGSTLPSLRKNGYLPSFDDLYKLMPHELITSALNKYNNRMRNNGQRNIINTLKGKY